MAAAMNTPISVMETAGEGGAWGIAVLASYMVQKAEGESLGHYLKQQSVCRSGRKRTGSRSGRSRKRFDEFIEIYKAGLPIQRAAIDSMAL